MRRRTLLKFIAALAACGVILALILAPWGRAPDLRSVGKRIPMTRGYAIYGQPQRIWISEREQINFRHIRQPGLISPFPMGTQATAFDMERGGSHPTQSLNQRLAQVSSGDHPLLVDEWEPSLDGKWIAFTLFEHLNKRWGFGIARTDGSELRSIHLVDNADCHMQWSPVDRNLLVLCSYLRKGPVLEWKAHSYDPDHLESPQILRLQDGPYAYSRLGMTRRGRILDILDWNWGHLKPNVSVSLMETDPQMADGTPKRWAIQPPKGTVISIALSTKGDRLAWLISSHNSGPANRLLGHLLRYLGFRESDVISLWISSLDGSGMREIAKTNSSPHDFGGNLGWTPSDSAISLALSISGTWIVPVK